MIICPNCQQKQYSLTDKKYLEIFKICWTCDRKRWKAGKLSLEDFEIKERHALEESVKGE